ncbi:hypothetical protein EsDP_00006032 [Epichloe bromicola]|uniref:Uncharacterized protein n=1 Tax=Epichloe bromicola TaxID=79588 RepID=A0ABQ0CWE9_9HYPO
MSSTTPQDFVAAQEKHEYHLLPKELQALKAFLTDSSVPATQTAQDLTSPVISLHQKAKTDPSVLSTYEHSTLWRSIADAIRQLPEFNDKLVDLVVEIQKVSDPEDLFSTMSGYQQYWSEFVFDFKVPRSDDPERDSKRQAWTNINAFCAKISTRGVPALDERSRAAWTFKETLERAPWEQFHHSDIDEQLDDDPDDEVVAAECAYELECRDVRVLEYWVPAAAAWVKYNARGIYEMEGKMSRADEEDWEPTTWKGKKGWSKERFAYWTERFEWISKVTALKRETRKEAANAAETMKKVAGQ